MSMMIRVAQDEDASAIVALVNYYAEQNITLPRTEESVRQTLDDWVVVTEAIDEPALNTTNLGCSAPDSSSQIIACGALVALTDELAEVRSLAVMEGQQGKGLGAKIVNQLVDLAKERGYKQVCALTLTEGFFLKLGFQLVDRWSISPKVWQACIYCPKFHRCDEVAVLMNLKPNMTIPEMHPAHAAASASYIMPEPVDSRQPAWSNLLKWKAWQPLKLAYKQDNRNATEVESSSNTKEV